MPILNPPAELFPLPAQPEGVAWPTTDWPTGPVAPKVDREALDAHLDLAFGSGANDRFDDTYAAIVVHHGKIVVERYGSGADEATPLRSWSMAKSVTHALVGILVDQGLIDPHAPAPVPEWAADDDPRHAITIHQMLRMVDGLDFNETYVLPEGPDDDQTWSHCIDMLFGAGVADHAAYAAARPARVPPDTEFNYSSGTSNIIARAVCDIIGLDDDAAAWMHEHLLDPIGATSGAPVFDEAGQFVGSSYFNATARDWARFGLLYLRGGVWDGRQIVPKNWVDDGRTVRARNEEGDHYGAHWWIAEDGRGTFSANGYEWQQVTCVPKTDAVFVRLGKTTEPKYEATKQWFGSLIAMFDDAD